MSMTPDAAHVLAVIAGVVFGSAATSTACWVWLRKQIFAYEGPALTGAGVVLLGLSIWNSVEFGISSAGMNMKLQAELERQSNGRACAFTSIRQQLLGDSGYGLLTE
jgi:hypothetical protein